MRYVGTRDPRGYPTVVVQVPKRGGRTFQEIPLDPRLDLRNHSPSGLNWGYGGSGPAQLALAILCHMLNERGHARPDEHALRRYQQFKFQVVGRLPEAGFKLPLHDVEHWFLTTPLKRMTG